MTSTTPHQPATAPTEAALEAAGLLELGPLATLRAWFRRFAHLDHYHDAQEAMGCLEHLASELRSSTLTPPPSSSCPASPSVLLVSLGQGEYRRNVCGDPATGRLDVHA